MAQKLRNRLPDGRRCSRRVEEGQPNQSSQTWVGLIIVGVIILGLVIYGLVQSL